ncbi:MAG: carbohydrate ABC transporter permease [Bacilli bacterium]|nr:carbohydrate ABC transporter permease [Bacilli bacterium]MBR1582057.1 carbohydrate ABC transporter permease [Bacilli bacterium]
MNKRKVIKTLILSLICLIVVAIILFPIIWMLPAAFKGKVEIWALPNTWLPKVFKFDNFEKIFSDNLMNDISFVSSLGATSLVSVIAVVCSLIVNMFAAYVFANFEFRGKNFLWYYFLITMFIPGITILLTSIRVVSVLKMTDTIAVLIIPGLVSAYNIFFFRQFYFGIPRSLEEAAIIDGCSRFRIFFKVFLPMSVTPMVIIGVSVFMGYWNSFMWPTLTIVNNSAIAQVMQVIRQLNSTYSGEYGVVIAATLISILIPLTLFTIFQKKIIAGIAISGLK